MHQAGQPALPGVGQVHREKVSLSNTVGCAPPASSLPLRSSGAGAQELHQLSALSARRDAGGRPHPMRNIPSLEAPPAAASSLEQGHSNRQLRVLVAFFGLLDRGIYVSGPSIQHKIISPLRQRFRVRVACFDSVADTADGTSTCRTARIQLTCDVYKAETLSQTRAAVWRLCGEPPSNCTPTDFYTGGWGPNAPREFRRLSPPLCPGTRSVWTHGWHGSCRTHRVYDRTTSERAMHQMYSEYRIARYLATLPPDRFDAVVALSADLHFNQPPETIVSEVLAIRRAGRGVLTSGQNHNYTDGVYIGSPRDVGAVLGRFAEFRTLEPLFWIKSQHYEGVLKKAFVHHNMPNFNSKLHFFKIRATCAVSWQAPYADRYGARAQTRYVRLQAELVRSLKSCTSCSCACHRNASLPSQRIETPPLLPPRIESQATSLGMSVLPNQPLPTMPSIWPARFGLGRRGPCPQADGGVQCHAQRSAELVERLFSYIKRGSVSRRQLETFTAGTHGRYCMMVKVERRRVLVNSSWQPLRGKPFHKSRIMDVPCLLRSALRRNLTVPDVEMVVCGSDVPSRPTQGEERVPFLHGVQQVGTAHAIPVPVWSRWVHDGLGGILSSNWSASSKVAQLIAGRVRHASAAVPWKDKANAALFRGRIAECKTKDSYTFFALKPGDDGSDVMVPGPGTCFRRAIVERLARLPHFDLGLNLPHLNDSEWERYKMQLVIGGTGGWTDRMRKFAFMTSVTVLIDSGTFEWWYPLLTEGVHYLRTSTNVSMIAEQVEWALANDGESARIAAASRSYAMDLLRLENQEMYLVYVARAYARTLGYSPVHRKGFRQPTCRCSTSSHIACW